MRKPHIPAQVWPLASFLAEEMEHRGWTTADAAARMGPDRDFGVDALALDFVLAVQDERMIVDTDLCECLSRAFGTSADFWRNIHATWQQFPDRREPFECPEHLLSGSAGPALEQGESK